MSDVWMRCSACKSDIDFGAAHWVCSVSTCNRNRMRLVFCSVSCWDSHVAMARHRDSWAVEARAPSKAAWERELAEQREAEAAPVATVPAAPPTGTVPAAPTIRRHVVNEPPRPAPPPASFQGSGPALAEVEREILVVVSKLKKYIRDRSGFNTSDSVAEVLSDHVRAICDQAIRTAATDGRKTVLDRDVPKPRS